MKQTNATISPDETSVILLAAGHGTRMRPLTNITPKPLLKVGKLSLIEHHITKLRAAGFKNIVINTAYLGDKIQQKLGSGEDYGIEISYSDESDTGPLETAGGIKKSLELLHSDPFLVINADIFTDFDFTSLAELDATKQGCLVLVPNPDHNPSGDFGIDDDGLLDMQSTSTMTFSGIAMYRKQMFVEMPNGKLALGPIIKRMSQQNKLAASVFYGAWTDVGTPERLAQLNSSVKT